VLPAHNAERYIGETLASIRRQTYQRLEVLVVDDGSIDQTSEIVALATLSDPRITAYKQRNQGVAAARNFGFKIARGELVAPIDSDDIWFPEKIQLQVERFRESPPEVGLVYTWSVKIDTAGAITKADFSRSVEGRVLEPLILAFFLGNSSVPMIRRECLQRVCGYNEKLRAAGGQGCEDWDLALRIAESFEFRVVPRFLVGYRQTPASMSHDTHAMARSYELMMSELRGRHPEVHSEIWRLSRAGFYAYIHQKSHANGDYRRALAAWWRAFVSDPLFITYPRFSLAFARSAALLVLSALFPHYCGDRVRWQSIRKKIFATRRANVTISDLEAKRIRPIRGAFDQLRERRWRRIVSRSGAFEGSKQRERQLWWQGGGA